MCFQQINQAYKDQLQRLDFFVMVRFTDEKVIQPAESSVCVQ